MLEEIRINDRCVCVCVPYDENGNYPWFCADKVICQKSYAC